MTIENLNIKIGEVNFFLTADEELDFDFSEETLDGSDIPQKNKQDEHDEDVAERIARGKAKIINEAIPEITETLKEMITDDLAYAVGEESQNV